MKMYRHGDVILVRREALPKGEVTEHKELTIALGEATGHHHTLYPATSAAGSIKKVVVGDVVFLEVGEDYFLRHQEHREIRIDPGCYEILIEKERDPFRDVIRKVVD